MLSTMEIIKWVPKKSWLLSSWSLQSGGWLLCRSGSWAEVWEMSKGLASWWGKGYLEQRGHNRVAATGTISLYSASPPSIRLQVKRWRLLPSTANLSSRILIYTLASSERQSIKCLLFPLHSQRPSPLDAFLWDIMLKFLWPPKNPNDKQGFLWILHPSTLLPIFSYFYWQNF